MISRKTNRSQSNAIEKSSVDPLFYLGDRLVHDKLTNTQSIALKKLLLVRENLKNNTLWKVDSVDFKASINVPLEKKN